MTINYCGDRTDTHHLGARGTVSIIANHHHHDVTVSVYNFAEYEVATLIVTDHNAIREMITVLQSALASQIRDSEDWRRLWEDYRNDLRYEPTPEAFAEIVDNKSMTRSRCICDVDMCIDDGGDRCRRVRLPVGR